MIVAVGAWRANMELRAPSSKKLGASDIVRCDESESDIGGPGQLLAGLGGAESVTEGGPLFQHERSLRVDPAMSTF